MDSATPTATAAATAVANGHATMKESSCLLASLLFGQLDMDGRKRREAQKTLSIFSSPHRSTRHNIRRGRSRKEVGDKEGSISCHQNKIETRGLTDDEWLLLDFPTAT